MRRKPSCVIAHLPEDLKSGFTAYVRRCGVSESVAASLLIRRETILRRLNSTLQPLVVRSSAVAGTLTAYSDAEITTEFRLQCDLHAIRYGHALAGLIQAEIAERWLQRSLETV